MEGTTVRNAAPIDWAAAERLAARCGPRTRRLVAERSGKALADWLRWARENASFPETWAAYVELAELVAAVGDVDAAGDMTGGAA